MNAKGENLVCMHARHMSKNPYSTIPMRPQITTAHARTVYGYFVADRTVAIKQKLNTVRWPTVMGRLHEWMGEESTDDAQIIISVDFEGVLWS